jgi:hypothetical protein
VSNLSILHIVCGCVCIEYIHAVFTHDITIHAYDTHKGTPRERNKHRHRQTQTLTQTQADKDTDTDTPVVEDRNNERLGTKNKIK